jgi:phosphoglycerate dehydrogenase-like enzyme
VACWSSSRLSWRETGKYWLVLGRDAPRCACSAAGWHGSRGLTRRVRWRGAKNPPLPSTNGWTAPLRTRHFELQGKTIGLIGGSGGIGSEVTRLARALGMEVLISSRSAPAAGTIGYRHDGVELVRRRAAPPPRSIMASCQAYRRRHVAAAPLPYGAAVCVAVYAWLPPPGGCLQTRSVPDLLRRADVVSIHCPLTDSTRGLIGAQALRSMKPTALLINTARGAIVDEAALTQALAAGEIAAAALDVQVQEPPPAAY